ncbi:MAG: BadF/BadG/BcrA/BcrD ATPase family protein [Propionicimonas sp.]|nr:BadF/BadG/BcrA/BcrD ATPase family protein [Propionicimonas sp.]
MGYVIAVDGGGTSTRAVVADTDGHCLGYARAGSGNPISAGHELAAGSFVGGISAALDQAGVAGGDVDCVLFSMAGGITTGGVPAFVRRLQEIGIDRPPVQRGDLLGSFCSGTWELDGYGLASGTGAGAVRITGSAITGISDGLGWLVGDEGSGFFLGSQAVRAALADLDRRGPATALTELIVRDLGIDPDREPEQEGRVAVLVKALPVIYQLRPVELARCARYVFEVGDDPVAGAIRERAAEGLARSLRAIVVPEVSGPVVFGGSVLTRQPAFMDEVAALVADALPSVRDYVAVEDGMVGAVMLALREVGVEAGQAVFETVANSLAELPTRIG